MKRVAKEGVKRGGKGRGEEGWQRKGGRGGWGEEGGKRTGGKGRGEE